MKKRAVGSGLLYGVNPLLEALRAGDRAPAEILVAESARDERLRELIELARSRNISVKRVPRAVLDRAVGSTHHQGVMALSRLIEQLKERNVWVVGTAADAPMDYTEWDWTRPSAVVLGGEGAGLHRLVRERCDALMRIPVHGRIETLNVSVATGVVLYEALRHRKTEPSKV